MSIRRISHIDADTGELIAEGTLVVVARRPKHPYKDRWIMLNQDKVQEIALDRSLDGTDLRVYLYLLGMLDYENYIPMTQTQVAEQLGVAVSES